MIDANIFFVRKRSLTALFGVECFRIVDDIAFVERKLDTINIQMYSFLAQHVLDRFRHHPASVN